MNEATAITKVSATEQLAMARKQEAANAISQVGTFDWKKLPPPIMAQLLTRVPFPAAEKDGPPVYLTEIQAMVYAIRCYELGLSPFSNELWFNPKTCKVNVTTEGKQKLARDRGYNLGPPRYERKERDWPKGKLAPQGITKDIGYVCRVSTGKNDEPAEYTAWLSEWYVSKSPMWRDKPEHMLQIRSYEKCISFASGVGTSEMPNDQDIASAVQSETVTPTIEVTDVEYKEMK